jgi:hypothetical protein
MKSMSLMRFGFLVVACLLFPSLVAAQTAAPKDPGWPRIFHKDGTTVVLHQPQVDSWKDYDKLRFRCALEVTLQGAPEPKVGVAAVEADTTVFRDDNSVVLTAMKVALRFPGASQDESAALKAVVNDVLPNHPGMAIALDRVMAYMHDSPAPKGVQLNLDPPPIFYSDSPAILVMFMGQPDFKPIKDTRLMFAVNTNWLIILDDSSAQYYLLNGASWLTTADPINGPWSAAATLPSEFSKLPTDGWEEVRKNMPGQPAKIVPRVITSTTPAELIATNGTPTYTPIFGTSLMYVSNPLMPVFQDLSDSDYYYMTAGRWFRASAITGPWTAASASLPAEFAKIPHDSPVAFVLPSVPGTQEAKDAALLASVPQKATVTISQAKVDVAYQGPPKFIPIEGTSMQYAVNTGSQVILAAGSYYCCSKGVWFVSTVATGPWAVCTSVPGVVYTIPPSCPDYNVTYVTVVSSTPTTVTCSYTSGYSGEYVRRDGRPDVRSWHAYGRTPCEQRQLLLALPAVLLLVWLRRGVSLRIRRLLPRCLLLRPLRRRRLGRIVQPRNGEPMREARIDPDRSAPQGAVQAYNPWTGTLRRPRRRCQRLRHMGRFHGLARRSVGRPRPTPPAGGRHARLGGKLLGTVGPGHPRRQHHCWHGQQR